MYGNVSTKPGTATDGKSAEQNKKTNTESGERFRTRESHVSAVSSDLTERRPAASVSCCDGVLVRRLFGISSGPRGTLNV